MTGTFTPNILRQRTVGGTPECKVQFPTGELGHHELSNLAEIKPQQESPRARGCQQDDDSPYSAIPTHMDVWLPIGHISYMDHRKNVEGADVRRG